MAGKAGGQDDDLIVDINVTPLVDVVLVLLIIFMVTARLMIPPTIPIELPKGATGVEDKSSPLSVTITRAKDGLPEQFYLNGKLVSAAQMQTQIQQTLKEKGKSTQVIIAADQMVPHGKVIWLLDLLRQIGVEQYAFNIDPAPSP